MAYSCRAQTQQNILRRMNAVLNLMTKDLQYKRSRQDVVSAAEQRYEDIEVICQSLNPKIFSTGCYQSSYKIVYSSVEGLHGGNSAA